MQYGVQGTADSRFSPIWLPQLVQVPSMVLPGLPFSPAVRVGNMLYLSGQIGNTPGTRQLADTGIAGQTRQAFENIKTVLQAAGSSLERVVKCTVFLADIAEWPAFNTVYREFFKKPFPARSALAASGLAMNARVELECIAYVPQKETR